MSWEIKMESVRGLIFQIDDVDSIHFYSQNSTVDYKTKIKGIVKNAIINVEKTIKYTVTAELKSIFHNLFFYNYTGNNFEFYVEKEKHEWP